MNTSKSSIRDRIHKQRLLLTDQQQADHALAVADIFFKQSELLMHQHIALYLANRGELATTPLINRLNKQNKTLFLPVLHPERNHELVFQSYLPGMPLIKNKYGINEPEYDDSKMLDAQQLDLILLPLVAFDDHGQRIGMGGGYYDRSLAHITKPNAKHRPLLIGIAHNLQRIPSIQAEAWDIKLNGIITESGFTRICG